MKRNSLTIVVGVILILIFLLLLFTFQVRQTEVVVVTTFDKPSRPIDKPGLYFKWPRPIQKVYTFDKRIHNLEDQFEETLTRNGYPILINVYAGWTIENPQSFFTSFPAGTAAAAEPALKSLVRSSKAAIVGQHVFSDFISTDPQHLKFSAIENEILNNVRDAALQKYGIKVAFLGIKRIGLPESVTEKVFDRMKAERQREVDRLQAQGEAEALTIRSAAERDRNAILSKAEAEATAIRGQADKEAQQSFAAFAQNPSLAIFLLNLKTLEQTLKERTTLILDERMSPFDMLVNQNNGNGTPVPNATTAPNGNAPANAERLTQTRPNE
ncbi:MAG: protease modulator HflC [Verrucomicrobiales bacterium]